MTFNATRLKVAQLLAYQRRIDLEDHKREGDDGTRIGYWRAISETERQLILLRADSVLREAGFQKAQPEVPK